MRSRHPETVRPKPKPETAAPPLPPIDQNPASPGDWVRVAYELPRNPFAQGAEK